MEITIDTDVLTENNLSVSDYCMLYLLWKDSPEEARKITNVNITQLTNLQSAGWLKLGVKEGTNTLWFPNCAVRAKFLALVTTDENLMWYELCSKYPYKVPNGRGGFRPLRTSDPDAYSNQKAKNKYLKIVKGKPELHKRIMAQLDSQLDQNRGNLQYMQGLEVWINQRTWEKYEPMVKKESNKKKESYGNTVV